ncbi:hypothetical protein ACA910_005984 [Epithemia clementina (nom. ined.)]
MSLRHRLLNGGRSYGPMLMSDSPIIAELLAMVGYDHMVLDHEHSVTDIRSGQELLRAMDAAAAAASGSHATRTEPIVRVPSSNDPVYIKKVLDSMRLPGGLLVPMVEDATTAENIVRAARYPSQKSLTSNDSNNDDDDIGNQSDSDKLVGGIRGCAIPFIRASSWNFRTNYMKEVKSDLLLMLQVESARGVDAISEIAQVPGVDGIFIGPLDLSCSIGEMGQFQKSDVADLIRKAEEAVLQSPAFLAGFRSPNRTVQEMFDSGYSLVCGSVDLGLLRAAAITDARSGKAAVKSSESKSKKT